MSQCRTAYRSVRYTSVRKDAYTAGSVPQFRSKRRSVLGSTLEQTDAGSKVQIPHNFIDMNPPTCDRFVRTDGFHPAEQRTILRRRIDTALKKPAKDTYNDSYIDTFHILMSPLDSKYKEEKQYSTTTPIEHCLPKVPLSGFSSFELEDSEFTLLDVFDRPHQAVHAICRTVTEELKKNELCLKEIKYELQHLKQGTTLALQDMQAQGEREVARLWALLHNNQIKEQERKLKNKRELHELNRELAAVREGLHTSLTRGEDMQSCIFDCKPFQLPTSGEKLTQIYL